MVGNGGADSKVNSGLSFAGTVASFTDTTDASNTTTAAAVFAGGVAVAKQIYTGTGITVLANAANPASGALIHVVAADAAVPTIQCDASQTTGGTYNGRASEGTIASPSATGSGRTLVQMAGQGYANSAYTATKGYIGILSNNAWTISDNSTYLLVGLTPTGSITRQDTFRIDVGKLTLTAATSGGLILAPTAATAQNVTIATAAQTVGATTLTLPDMAGTSDTFAFLGKNQTFTGSMTVQGTNNANATTFLVQPAAYTSGANTHVMFTTPADTGLTASTEALGFRTVTGTRTWATTGTVALQRENFFAGPTYASASASQTFTDAFTLYATPPIAGSNAIFTRGHTLGIVDSTSAASSITGAVVIATTLGTTATSVGIGGGNINLGGTLTAGTSTVLNSVAGSTALTVTPAAQTSGVTSYITWTIPADTGLTAATESIGFKGVTGTRTWATTGTVALQRENYFPGPTYASAGASQTFTDATTVYIDRPLVGTNAIFTRAHSLTIVDSTSAASAITGGFVISTTLGTAATSVGIGGGNVNAGGLITGGTITSTGTFTASAGSTFTGVMTVNNAATFNGTNATTAVTITNTARTSGVLPYFKINLPADTGQTAATESPGFLTVTATRTWATTGTVATQREYLFVAPTYASASPSQTFTNAATVAISAAPIQGSNAIITNAWSLWVQGGNSLFAGSILAGSANAKIGFQTGTSAGGAITQATSRTTGVTLNTSTGAITLVSAAGTASWQTFTVTNSTVVATDVIVVSQKSGTDLYQIFITNVGAGVFNISFATTGGTTSEQPVFNFVVIKGSAS